MKNLKKVLSLGLALVMLLGMFTVASAAEDKKTASDLTDWNTVQHKDAVSLMVDLGIINGMPDGSFSPTGNIDRASWAKMVYFAATGSDDADAYLGTASGLNDIAGNWAESYISFLKANAYISGDNFGNYNPSANVTVAEACKMMLTVLGYDAEDRGYQNNQAWSGNIMRDAKRNGLMDNVDTEMTALVPLTRENAAEIVLNALNANMVEGEPQWDGGVQHIAKYSKLYTLGYDVFNMIKVTAVVDDIDADGLAIITTVTGPTATELNGNKALFAVANSITGKVTATPDLVGEEVNVYVKADGFKWDASTGEINTVGAFQSMISSAAAKTATTPAKVITSGIARWNDLTVRGNSNYVATGFIQNENKQDAPAWYYNGKSSNEDTVKNVAKKRGTVVEFYTDVDGLISIVKAYDFIVDKVENGEVTTKTLSNGTVQVKVPGVINSFVDADKVNGWQGLVEGDVVLYYTTDLGSGVKSYTLEKAEKITGKVSGYNNDGELTVGGARRKATEMKMDYSDVPCTEAVFKDWLKTYTLVDEFDVYLDKNGSICAMEQVTESVDQSKVCLVLDTDYDTAGLGVKSSLKAELLFVDGSTEIVTVSKVGKKLIVDKIAEGKEDVQTTAKAGYNALKADVQKAFYNWKSTSAGYELSRMDFTNDARNWNNPVTLGDGTAKVATVMQESGFAKDPADKDKTLTTMLKADGNTTFIVGKEATDGTVSYSVHKSFRNVPSMDATIVTAIAQTVDAANPKDDATTAKYVYLQTSLFKDDVPEGYVFIVNNKWTADPELEDTYLVNIVDTNGAQTTMRVNWDLADAISKDSMKLKDSDKRTFVGNFFEVGAIDENGVVTSLGATVNDTFNENKAVKVEDLSALGNDVVTFAKGDSWDYDDSTKFVYVDWGWADDPAETSEHAVSGQRDDEYDICAIQSSADFSPNGFFNATDVSADKTAGKTYSDVVGVAIVPANSTTANYVYVIRTLW